jgi:tetratricopeptide (TPR) repeat protein
MAGKGPDFFVSYTQADRAWAEWIAWQLDNAGQWVVLQAWDFGPGSDWVHEMHNATATAKRTIAVLSRSYLRSVHGEAEWRAAYKKDPTGELGVLVPVRVEPVEPPGLLATRSYLDLVGLSEAAARAALLGLLDRPGIRPASQPVWPGSQVGEDAGEAKPRFPGQLPVTWHVPYGPNRNFVGRAGLLERLRSGFQNREGPRVVALVGLAGVGKTQLAVEYAYVAKAAYDLVWWIRAEDLSVALIDMAQLAAEPALGLGISGELAPQEAVRALGRWLQRHDRWLLILDNLEDPTQLSVLLPPTVGGDVLVTSRYGSDWKGAAEPVAVEPLGSEDAARFLLARSGEQDRSAAVALAEVLGGLSLALEQAAAFVAEANIFTLADYRDAFATRSAELLKLGRPADHEHGLDVVFSLLVERLRAESSAAVELLCLVAFVASDDLPWKVLAEHVDVLPAVLSVAAADPLELPAVVRALRRYSLIKTANEGLMVHRLVQTVIRNTLSREEQQQWAGVTLQLLLAAFPFNVRDPEVWLVAQRLLPHALQVAEFNEAFGTDPRSVGLLLQRLGNYLERRGQYLSAWGLLERALALYRCLDPSDEVLVAGCQVDLGWVLYGLHESEAAEGLVSTALAVYERLEDSDGLDVADCLLAMGAVYSLRQRWGEAQAVEERALGIRERVLGSDHPDTAHSLNNLANTLRHLGELERSRQLGEQALDIRERVLGPDHPSTARSLNNLANTLADLGELEQSEKLQQRARVSRSTT